jgi:hypothetical protein
MVQFTHTLLNMSLFSVDLQNEQIALPLWGEYQRDVIWVPSGNKLSKI